MCLVLNFARIYFSAYILYGRVLLLVVKWICIYGLYTPFKEGNWNIGIMSEYEHVPDIKTFVTGLDLNSFSSICTEFYKEIDVT